MQCKSKLMEGSCGTEADELMQSTSTFFGEDDIGKYEAGEVSCREDAEVEAKELSEEGHKLNQALCEAQRALEAARCFVHSPSLGERSQSRTEPPSSKVNMRSPLGVTVSTSSSQMAKETFDFEESPLAAERLKLAAKLAEVVKPEFQGMKLCPRIGEAAARARVRRAKSLEAAKRCQSEAEAEARAAARAEAAAAIAAHRKRAARRAASEKRARRCAMRQEEELHSLAAMRREEQRCMGLRYAKSANRRVESERIRREDLTRKVLASLHAEQAARREAELRKGQELQQRCQDADFAHCKALVESRRRRHGSTPPRNSSFHLPPIDKRGLVPEELA